MKISPQKIIHIKQKGEEVAVFSYRIRFRDFSISKIICIPCRFELNSTKEPIRSLFYDGQIYTPFVSVLDDRSTFNLNQNLLETLNHDLNYCNLLDRFEYEVQVMEDLMIMLNVKFKMTTRFPYYKEFIHSTNLEEFYPCYFLVAGFNENFPRDFISIPFEVLSRKTDLDKELFSHIVKNIFPISFNEPNQGGIEEDLLSSYIKTINYDEIVNCALKGTFGPTSFMIGKCVHCRSSNAEIGLKHLNSDNNGLTLIHICLCFNCYCTLTFDHDLTYCFACKTPLVSKFFVYFKKDQHGIDVGTCNNTKNRQKCGQQCNMLEQTEDCNTYWIRYCEKHYATKSQYEKITFVAKFEICQS